MGLFQKSILTHSVKDVQSCLPGANVCRFTCERYHNTKYRNSPFYKEALLWDNLPVNAKQCLSMSQFKKSLMQVFRQYFDRV